MADSSHPSSPSRSADFAAPLPVERPLAVTVDARLVEAIGAFGRAKAPRDVLPEGARHRLTAIPSFGVNPDLSRFVRTGPDGESYYYVAGTDSVALVNQGGAGTIDDIDHALSGDAVGTQDCAAGGSGLRVVGILPPGATDAVIHLVDGSAVAIDTVELVYVAMFPKVAGKLPATVEWTQAGERRRTSVPVPFDILSGRCGGGGSTPRP